MTIWDIVEGMWPIVVIPVLVVVLLSVLVSSLRVSAQRNVTVRMFRWLLLMALYAIVVVLPLWVLLAISIELFGESETLTFAPTVVIALMGFALYAWGRLAWRIKAEKPIGPRCRKCGYDMAGLDVDAKPPCPECGRVVVGRKELYRAPIRKWATRLGVLIMVAGVGGPTAERIHRLGWMAMVPNEVLLRMTVMDIAHDAARAELGRRNVYLYDVDPHWTRDVMVAFSDAYDNDGSGGKNWMIFNRFYALYQCSKDAETLKLAESWLGSPSVGKRITASGMMTVDGFCPKDERLRLLRPLLNDPDHVVQTHALRALTFDASLPLDELLAFVNAPHQGLWSGEMNAALTHYNDPLSRAARLRLAADTSSGWSDLVTWSLLHEAFDFNGGTVSPGAIRTLAKAKAVPPTARTAWWRNAGFHLVYSSLIDAAVARAGSDGEDAETAAWCRSALVSYATTPPMAVPGAPASLVPAILLVLDDQIKAEGDPVIKRRLLDLRKVISPGSLDEDVSVPGDMSKKP